MTQIVKGFYVKDRQTGEIKFAVYGPTKSGNLRLHVDGKAYSDKSFDKKFQKHEGDN